MTLVEYFDIIIINIKLTKEIDVMGKTRKTLN